MRNLSHVKGFVLLLPFFLSWLLIMSPQKASAQLVEQLIDRAEIAENSSNEAEAENIWRKIVQIQPDAIWAYKSLGSVLKLQDKYDAAITAYGQAIQLNPLDGESYYDIGDILLEKKDLQGAITAYRQGIQLNPDRLERIDWSALGWKNLLEQTVATLQKDIQQSSENKATNYLLLGTAFQTIRRNHEATDYARQNFSAACKQYPDACSNSDNVKPELEIEAFRKAIEYNPQSAIAYQMLGISLYEQYPQHSYDESVTALRRAIALNPQLVKTYYRLADVLFAQDKQSEAVKILYQAVRVKPHTVGIDFGFWGSYKNTSRQPRSKIILALQQELQKNPSAVGYYILGNIQATLSLVSTQPSNGELDSNMAQASEYFRHSIQLDPKFAKAYDRLGFVLAFQKKFKEAEQVTRQAIQLDPNLISAYNNLRDVLRMQKKFNEAEQVYQSMQRVTAK